jgi:putative Mg2+ transporter-C (MgtC) family protein
VPPQLWSTSAQWAPLLPVLLAFVLATLVGLEREAGAKSAGLRTHALVGVGAAVFMVISKYGFDDLLGTEHIALDPSRVAAQIVSGIGFLGAGLIFVRKDAVRG